MKNQTPLLMGVVVALLAVPLLMFVPELQAEGPMAAEGAAADGFVVFYFHGNVRCATCKKIEAYADEAIHSGLAESLEDGALAWRVVNIDEPENRHFVQDFQLLTRSVVLAEFRGGEVIRWENLDKVWQLVRSKDLFVDYVQSETRTFIGTS